MPAEREARALPITIEVRKADNGDEVISGYAAVYYRAGEAGTEYRLWADTVERIQPGAFQSALARPDDVRALFNHDPNFPLGRLAAKTLTLSLDERGLAFECVLPNSEIGRNVAEAIRRGDVTGCSFSFNVRSQTWVETKAADGKPLVIREIRDVELFDVGPVTFPAYEATNVSAAKRSHQIWEGSRRHPRLDAARRRLRQRAGL